MFGVFDISASALTAQRMRLDTISSNVANFDSVLGPNGKPQTYRRLYPVFQAQRTASGGAGVRVASIEQDPSPFIEREERWNRAADEKGIVRYPNVDLATEMANAIESTRAYEANAATIETTKSMMNATLRLLA
jgi:flagellar basal-body rod protein FlgC